MDDSFLPNNGFTQLRPSETPLPAPLGDMRSPLKDERGEPRRFSSLTGAEICRIGQKLGVNGVSAENGRGVNAALISKRVEEFAVAGGQAAVDTFLAGAA